MSDNNALWLMAMTGTLFCSFGGCKPEISAAQNISQGVAIQRSELASLHERLAASVNTAPAKIMNAPGLVGAVGGAHLKLRTSDTNEIFLPLPQLANGQIPVCYSINSSPSNAVVEYRLRK